MKHISTDPGKGISYHLVDPALRSMLDEMPTFTLNAATLAIARQMPMGSPPLPPPAPQALERIIPGPASNPKLRVLVFDPSPGSKNRPALLHVHGGGYVLGTPEMSTPNLQRYALECSCVVVSVDYRLAPETPFPGALEDNYAGLKWLFENADSLGVDRARIGVGGESAGGGHAAMLALAARDRGELPVSFQFLVYPMLDDRTGSSRKVSPYIGEYVWTAGSNVFGWSALLGVPAGSASVPRGSVPARVEDLAGLPPAYIATGALDLFAPENLEYSSRLIAAGVPVDLDVVAGAFHGFDRTPDAEVARRFKTGLIAGLRRCCLA